MDVVVVQGSDLGPSNLAPRAHDSVDLEDRPARVETLGDVVGELPGVVMFRQGGLGAGQFVSIRGADFDQTVVLIDDVPVTGPDRGAVDFSLFPIDGFARVELFRGSAPIRYGAGTIGGVVRLVPKDAADRRVGARATAASFNTVDARAEAEGFTGSVGAVASGGILSSENDFEFLDDNATLADPSDDALRKRQNADVLQGNGFFYGSWERGAHRLAALSFGVHRDRGLPGPATGTSLDSRQQRTRIFGSLGYRFDGSAEDSPLDVFATVALGADSDRVQDPFGRVGLDREDTEDEFLSVDARTGAFVELLPSLTLGATVFYRRDEIRLNNLFATPGDQPSSRDLGVMAGELTYENAIEGVRLLVRGSVSAQLTRARLTRPRLGQTEVNELDEVVPNYRLETLIQPLDWLTFTGLLTSGTKLPTTIQLFGNRNTVVANTRLLPESSLGLDAGVIVNRTWGPFSVRAEGRFFWLRVEDIIIARQTAQRTVAFSNEREGESRGFEGGLMLSLGPWVESVTSATYLDTSFDNRGFQRRQPLRVPVRLFQRLTARLPGPGVETFFEVDHRSGFFPDQANLVAQQALTFVNAGLRAFSESDGASVLIAARNIFDELGQDLLAFPLPGRSFEATLQWKGSFL
ncbi:MAG: TonB-dependent receptor plug domain-containing protein [Myxococcota bacterium]